jgi:hypothetical protein
VQIIFLPPYSPNLNLIERLWRFLKKIVLYNRYYERFADLKGALLKFFANIKQYRSELKSLMALNFHTLGTQEFVVFYGATWLRQDCARPAILIHFFKMNEAGFNKLLNNELALALSIKVGQRRCHSALKYLLSTLPPSPQPSRPNSFSQAQKILT